MHRLFEFALRNVLDILVNGEDQVLARLRSLLDAREPLLARVHRDRHLARAPAKLVVKLAFNPAQAAVVRAHVSNDLRGQFSLGIEASRFLLKVNSPQV